jgi:hypothetical protein
MKEEASEIEKEYVDVLRKRCQGHRLGPQRLTTLTLGRYTQAEQGGMSW